MVKDKKNIYEKYLKRLFDFILSLVALIFLLPILLILIIVGSVAMKGNPFFCQYRPGKDGKIFKLIKLRTMSNEKGQDNQFVADEKRINKYGKIIRSLSIDELPELINILKGDLSIVGPRPQLVRDMVFMTDEQKRRHTVRAGLTGLAQVSGRNAITWEEKIEWDLKYIDNGITFIGDLRIILLTIVKVIKRSDVVREGTVSDIDFGDYLLSQGKITYEEYQTKQEEAKKLLAVFDN